MGQREGCVGPAGSRAWVRVMGGAASAYTGVETALGAARNGADAGAPGNGNEGRGCCPSRADARKHAWPAPPCLRRGQCRPWGRREQSPITSPPFEEDYQ